MRMKPSCTAGLPVLCAALYGTSAIAAHLSGHRAYGNPPALQAPPANVTAFIERNSRR